MNPCRPLIASTLVGVSFLALAAAFSVETAIITIAIAAVVCIVGVIVWRKFAQIIERVSLEWWQ